MQTAHVSWDDGQERVYCEFVFFNLFRLAFQSVGKHSIFSDFFFLLPSQLQVLNFDLFLYSAQTNTNDRSCFCRLHCQWPTTDLSSFHLKEEIEGLDILL